LDNEKGRTELSTQLCSKIVSQIESLSAQSIKKNENDDTEG